MPIMTLPLPISRKVALRTRRSTLCMGLAVLIALAWGTRKEAFADSRPDFVIIVHPANPATSLSRSALADLYLKRTTRWDDGESARPVDQRPDADARRAFSESVLKRSVAAVKRYWQQRIFSGRDLPPPELDGDEAVLSYVASHRGALGYVSGSAKLDRAKPVPVR
ncbi:MAG: substrate-binding domain-containing protein [Polyangiaceae bacterium]